MSNFCPFFINSNICLKKEDIADYDSFMRAICGNTGNSYITYALMKELGTPLNPEFHIQNIYEYDFSNQATDLDKINNQCTHVFLILQDQIRIAESYGLKLPYRQIISFLKQVNKPVVVAGLGANSFNGFDPEFHKKLDPELIWFLKELSDKTEIIGLRGAFTQEVLHNIGIDNTQVIGCPSFFEMGRNRVIIKKAFRPNMKIACSVMPKKFIRKNHCSIYLQDKNEGPFIKQLCFSREEGLLNVDSYFVFSNIDDWKKSVAENDFSMSFRLHGTILALNSGIPALCMNGDSRAREMSEFLHIPYRPDLANEPDLEKIYNECSCDDMNKNYPTLYDNFSSFMKKHELTIVENFDSKKINIPKTIMNKHNNIHKTTMNKFNRMRIRLLSHITFGKTKARYKAKWLKLKGRSI